MVLKSRATRRFLTAVAMLGSGALIAACGGSTNGDSAAAGSSATGASRGALSLQRAADLSTGAAGYRANMAMTESIAGQTINIDANGVYSPKLHQASISMGMALPAAIGGEQTFQIVMDKGAFYMKFPALLASRLPGGKPWVSLNLADFSKASHVPGFGSLVNSASTLNDPGEYLRFLTAAANGSVTDLGPETIAGVQTTHYEAQLQFSKIAAALPAADRSSMEQLFASIEQKVSVPDFPADVWIDGSGLIRRLMLNMKETVAGHAIDAQMTENFSDYGVQPAPTIPSPDETTDLMSLIHSGG